MPPPPLLQACVCGGGFVMVFMFKNSHQSTHTSVSDSISTPSSVHPIFPVAFVCIQALCLKIGMVMLCFTVGNLPTFIEWQTVNEFGLVPLLVISMQVSIHDFGNLMQAKFEAWGQPGRSRRSRA